MPWRVTSPMYQRQRFVLDAEHTPASFAELCRRYGISRETGYKWLDRYTHLGPDSLADRSHRPQQCPHATAPALIREILQLRKHWRWGARNSVSYSARLIPPRRCRPRRPSIGSCPARSRPPPPAVPNSRPSRLPSHSHHGTQRRLVGRLQRPVPPGQWPLLLPAHRPGRLLPLSPGL
jgi:transposase-like protein